jgi:hypothetical protein
MIVVLAVVVGHNIGTNPQASLDSRSSGAIARGAGKAVISFRRVLSVMKMMPSYSSL